MHFELITQDVDEMELLENTEYTYNIFGVFYIDKKELMDSLLMQILSKDNFTKEDKEKYRDYVIKNKLTPEDIDKEAKEKKYCICRKVSRNKIECEIDDRLKEAVSEKDFLITLLALMEIVYGYKYYVIKIIDGELETVKQKLRERITTGKTP